MLHTYCRGSKICWSFDFFAAALWTEKAGAPGGAQSSSPYPGCPLRAVHSPRWGVGRVEALLPAGCSQTHLCPQGMNNLPFPGDFHEGTSRRLTQERSPLTTLPPSPISNKPSVTPCLRVVQIERNDVFLKRV